MKLTRNQIKEIERLSIDISKEIIEDKTKALKSWKDTPEKLYSDFEISLLKSDHELFTSKLTYELLSKFVIPIMEEKS